MLISSSLADICHIGDTQVDKCFTTVASILGGNDN